jgi:hypothetical protein
LGLDGEKVFSPGPASTLSDFGVCLLASPMTQMLSVALWAFLHGMTVLEAAEVFGELKPASSFEFGLQMWIGAASAER